MAITIKPIDKIVAKWKSKAGSASGDYAEGIQFAPDQGAAAAAAKETWQQGVSGAGVADRFAKNAAASTAKWKKNAVALGGSRYTQGVANATEEFAKGISGPLSTIAGVNLPPRKPKGDPSNLDRVRIVNEALRAAKVAGR